MELAEIIGQNIKEFREKLGYTQDQLGKYLKVDTSTISNYEGARREISIVQLQELADLFGIKLDDLLETDSQKSSTNLAFAFRSNGLENEDLNSIAEFQRVVKNYLEMKQLVDEKE